MTNNQSPFGAFAEGIAGGINQGTSNYLVGRQFRQQQEQQVLQKELQTWQKGIGTMQMVIEAGKQFKDPISRQNFYNNALSDDFIKTMPAQVGTFASAFKNMPVNQQNDFAVITKELHDMAVKGDITNFPITMAKARTLNHQYDWGGEKQLDTLQALYDKMVGRKDEAKAIEVFTQGVQSPSGYMRQTALSPTLDMGGLNKNLLSGSPNMQEGLMWKPPTEAQKLEAIANLPKDSKLADRLMPKEPKEVSDIQKYEYAVAQGYKGMFNDWLLQKARAGATNVTTKVDNFQPASIEAQKEFMKEVKDNYNRLKDAPAQIANIEKAKTIVLQKNPLLGSFSNAKLNVVKFMRNNLGIEVNTADVKNAEELRTRLFSQIMDNLKKLDAQPSQMQQQIMMDSLGKLDTDPAALPNILDAVEEGIRNRVQLHNEMIDKTDPAIKFPFNPKINIDRFKQQVNTGPKETVRTKGVVSGNKIKTASDYLKKWSE